MVFISLYLFPCLSLLFLVSSLLSFQIGTDHLRSTYRSSIEFKSKIFSILWPFKVCPKLKGVIINSTLSMSPQYFSCYLQWYFLSEFQRENDYLPSICTKINEMVEKVWTVFRSKYSTMEKESANEYKHKLTGW